MLFVVLLFLSTGTIIAIFKVESDTSSTQFIADEQKKLAQESYLSANSTSGDTNIFNTLATFHPKAASYQIDKTGNEIRRSSSALPLDSIIPNFKTILRSTTKNEIKRIENFIVIYQHCDSKETSRVLIYDKHTLKERNGKRFLFYYILLVTSSLIMSFVYAKLKEKQVIIREREHEFLAKLHEQNHELEEKNNAYLEALNSKNRFFSIVAHDLRNPFQVVLGYTGLLLENYENMNIEEIKEYFLDIETATGQLMRLLDNLLLWSQSQTGTIRMRPTRIDLQSLVSSTMALVQVNASTKKVELISHIPPHCYVEADRDMLLTILRNLMTNAVKYTPSDGIISVAALPTKDNFLEIVVKDSGIGMSQENMEKLFRTDTTYSHKGTNGEVGTGLGLVLCADFVEKQGGKIWVESELNEGSEFHFTLPHHPDSETKEKSE